MNKVLLLLALTITLTINGHAQKTLSPAERAARQLTMLQKKLGLNEDQVIKLRIVLVNREATLDSLHSNPSGDKKTDNQTRRAINEDADGKTFAILTTDQQALYAKWKQDQQLKRQLNRSANKAPAADSTQHP